MIAALSDLDMVIRMVDISVTDNTRALSFPAEISRLRHLLALILIALSCCGMILDQAREDKCESQLGKLSVALKLDSYYSNCRCMKHSLDFSDSCNSMYLPLI